MLLNGRTGAFAFGPTGKAFLEQPASIGVSGAYRRLGVSEFAAAPVGRKDIYVGGISIDAFLPIVPSSLEQKGKALKLTGNSTGASVRMTCPRQRIWPL
jgi:hypothetical protein